MSGKQKKEAVYTWNIAWHWNRNYMGGSIMPVTPIIFLRENLPQGALLDVRHCIYQARKWNPNGRVILIGDEHQPQDICEFHPIADYSENKRALKPIFKTSVRKGDEWFLWATTTQWCVIYELMESEGIQWACCLDSDVLTFSDLTKEGEKFAGCGLTLSCPHTHCQAPTYVSLMAVRGFTQYLFDLYNRRLDDSKNFLAIDPDSMALWSDYIRRCDPKPKVGETSAVIDGSTFDHNWALAGNGYEHDGKGKVARWINGQPWVGKATPEGTVHPVRFNTIHCWGDFKQQIPNFVKAAEEST